MQKKGITGKIEHQPHEPHEPATAKYFLTVVSCESKDEQRR